MRNLNIVAITGNLTRNPDLRYVEQGDQFVCKLRVAVSGWRKDPESAEWSEKPSYFDVSVWRVRNEKPAVPVVQGDDGAEDWRRPQQMEKVSCDP